ncbi:hypothetical protein KQ945_17785 [Bacillus subtilis subsp. subtilis]|nr:hypothetical protein [Bacillus subtilis subsp. subtilis]
MDYLAILQGIIARRANSAAAIKATRVAVMTALDAALAQLIGYRIDIARLAVLWQPLLKALCRPTAPACDSAREMRACC